MSARILLIAVLLWGPTGSAFCEARCARPAGPAPTASASRASTPAAAPCHGGVGAGSAQMAHAAGDHHAGCTCADADRVRPAGAPEAAAAPIASTFAASPALPAFPPHRGPAPRIEPPDRPDSPYLRHNPPLLS